MAGELLQDNKPADVLAALLQYTYQDELNAKYYVVCYLLYLLDIVSIYLLKCSKQGNTGVLGKRFLEKQRKKFVV